MPSQRIQGLLPPCVWGKLSPHLQTPHPFPTHPHTCKAPVNKDAFAPRWVGTQRGRHSHPHSVAGWTLSLPPPPTLTATTQPPPWAGVGGLSFESSPTLSRPTLSTRPSPEAPTLQRGTPPSSPFLNLTQLCPGRPERRLGSCGVRSWGKGRENPPHFGRRKSCRQMGSPHQRDPGFREQEKIKHPNKAASFSGIFHLDLTEKSSIGSWPLSSQRSKRRVPRSSPGNGALCHHAGGSRVWGSRVRAAVFRAAVMSAGRRARVGTWYNGPFVPLLSCAAHALKPHSGLTPRGADTELHSGAPPPPRP